MLLQTPCLCMSGLSAARTSTTLASPAAALRCGAGSGSMNQLAAAMKSLNSGLQPFSCSSSSTSTTSTSAATSSNGASASASDTSTSHSQLQQLRDAAKALLKQQRLLTVEEVQMLKGSISSIPLTELGIVAPPEVELDAQESQFKIQENVGIQNKRRKPIKYVHVYEDHHISIGIFCLPAASSIPLHNHPGMTVFSRVLYGHLYVESYDWVQQQRDAPVEPTADISNGIDALAANGNSKPGNGGSHQQQRLATLVVSKVQQPEDEPLALFPDTGGNIHTFTALTDCAVLDVLAPPYDPKGGRDCSYYYTQPADGAQQLQQRGLVQLCEMEPPDDFVVQRIAYTGERIVRTAPPRSRPRAGRRH